MAVHVMLSYRGQDAIPLLFKRRVMLQRNDRAILLRRANGGSVMKLSVPAAAFRIAALKPAITMSNRMMLA
jgi:hypothetical protein